MGLSLITPAATPAVSLAEAKDWARVEGSSQDATMATILAAAVAKVESMTGLVLGEQVWRLTLDCFSDTIELPRGPVTALAAAGFTYVDSAGAPQQVDPALYTLDLVSSPQWIVRNADATWPEVLEAVNVVQIQFTAGHTAATLPPALKGAVLTLAARWFDDRTNNDVPEGVMQALEPFRPLWIAA